MMRKFIFLIAKLLIVIAGFTQTPQADFSLPAMVCKGENLLLQNNSNNASSYSWDFCMGDLQIPPIANTLTIDEFDIPIGTSLIQSEGRWYGFVTSLNNSSVFRLDFGDSLHNPSPVFTNLGNIGGLIDKPQDIKAVEFAGEYYLFVNNRGDNQLVRVNLGVSIEATSGSADIIFSGRGFPNGGVDIAFDGTNWVAFVSKASSLIRISLGNKISNIPTPSDVQHLPNIPNMNSVGDIKLVRESGQWYGFVVGFRSRTLHRLTFGSELLQTPSVVQLSVTLAGVTPYGVTMKRDKNQWVLFSSTNEGNLLRFDLGEDIANNNPVYTNLGNLGQLKRVLKFDMAKSDSRWVGLATDWNSKEYFLFSFPQPDCPLNQSSSTNTDTVQLIALKPGTFSVSLEAKDQRGLTSFTTKNVTISDKEAPAIIIENDVCFQGSSIQFAHQINQPLTSATWTINNETRTGQTVTYDFPTPGTYSVTLEVESANGCGNRLTKEITIYEPPVPGFTVPAGQICSNGTVNFTNTTDARGADDLITYRWFVVDPSKNETLVSEEANPDITFAAGGTHTVRLEAGIPGCTEIFVQTIDILQGPTVSFTVPTVCQSNAVTFENQTVGAGITGYFWDFGDPDGGTYSSVTANNPTYTFDTPGTYPVTLRVTNALGCQNVYRQDVTVYAQPTVSFLSEVACAGSPTQFTDASTAGANANVSAWQWDFGDGIGTASTRNPTYAYRQAGTYAVKLITASTAGCVDSTVQTITVQSAVDVGFAAVRQCPTEARPLNVLLSDTSVAAAGETIDRWFWTVNGENFVSDEVEYAFPAPGDYPVSLTVFTASGCNATVQRVVSVTTSPAVAFTSTGSCTGEPVVFRGAIDAPGWGELMYAWEFVGPNGEATGTAATANAEFTFDAPGTYDVTLSVQTDGGCTFTRTQPVTIAATPVATFTTSADYGGTPLEVSFVNATTDATTYAWDFGGVGASEVAEPTFTFTELGTYVVTLTATNAAGCTATTQQTVEVVLPVQDLHLDDFTVADSPSGDGQQLVLTLSNRGTRVASGVMVTVDLDETLTVEERRAEPLLPGQTVTYVTKFRLPTTQRNAQRPLRYLCARIAATDADFAEAQLDNNRNCLSLNEQLNVEPPFPNPAREQLRVSVILPAAEGVSLRLLNQDGRVVRTHRQEATVAGLNTFLLDVKGLPVGAYVLQVSYRDVQRQFRVAVGR